PARSSEASSFGGASGRKLGCDDHRRGRADGLTVVDRLDVIAVGVEDVGGVVTRVIGALAWLAVVAASRGDCGGMEPVDLIAVIGLKSKVDPRGRVAVRGRQAELVGVDQPGRELRELAAEDRQNSRVEALARLQ